VQIYPLYLHTVAVHLLKRTDADSPSEKKAFICGTLHASLLTAGVYYIHYQKRKETLFRS